MMREKKDRKEGGRKNGGTEGRKGKKVKMWRETKRVREGMEE